MKLLVGLVTHRGQSVISVNENMKGNLSRKAEQVEEEVSVNENNFHYFTFTFTEIILYSAVS